MSWALLRKGREKQSVKTNTLLIQKVSHIWDFQLQIVHLPALHVQMHVSAESYFILHFC